MCKYCLLLNIRWCKNSTQLALVILGAGPLLEFIASQTEVQTAVGKHIAVFGGNEDDEEDTRYTRQKIASFALQCGSDRQEVRVIVSVAAVVVVVVVVATATRIEVFAFLDFIKAFYW